jgi:adenylate kinase
MTNWPVGLLTRTRYPDHQPAPLSGRRAPEASTADHEPDVDPSQLLDALEDEVKDGGCLIDWHACDVFPRSWIDLVVVLRVDSSTLYDRLKARNYPEAKLQENLDAEIMDLLIQEARDAYDDEIVVELRSDTAEEMEENLGRIQTWLEQWKQDNAKPGDSGARQSDSP